MGVIVYILLACLNVPGMLDGEPISFLGFGFIVGMGVASTIYSILGAV